MTNLNKKFCIYGQKSSFTEVYKGTSFKEACKAVASLTARKHGKGGKLHVSEESMEMAVEDKKHIVGYVGNTFDGRGNPTAEGYIGLVR